MMLFNNPTLIDGDILQGGLLFKNYDHKIINCQEVLPEDLILMQCTGLKDNNDKLIFEGDIFTVLHCGEKKVVVFWDDEQARFRVKNAAHNLLQTMRSDYIEVIGNIYENPELLKEVRGE